MLKKLSVIDRIEVIRNGSIQVRRADLILEDGEEIAKTIHRHVLHPGDDLTGQDKKVIAVAKVIWTSEVIKEYQDFLKDSK